MPVPITFCVAPARAATVALRAAVVVVPDWVPPRATVVLPAVALRAVVVAPAAGADVLVALLADTALRADVAAGCVCVPAVDVFPPRRCCGAAAYVFDIIPSSTRALIPNLFMKNPFTIHLILSHY